MIRLASSPLLLPPWYLLVLGSSPLYLWLRMISIYPKQWQICAAPRGDADSYAMRHDELCPVSSCMSSQERRRRTPPAHGQLPIHRYDGTACDSSARRPKSLALCFLLCYRCKCPTLSHFRTKSTGFFFSLMGL
ncbi:hypothetical protein H4582DRAFT_314235 [Lactarius indigo]|nr:hypothetical protein H4582DRAFT_314235 [Lactarius indigo]